MIGGVPVLRATALTEVPPRTVLGALLAFDTLRELFWTAAAESDVLFPGMTVELRTRVRGSTRLRVARSDADGVEFTAERRGYRRLLVSFVAAETGAGTLVTMTCRWESRLGTLFDASVARREVLGMLQALSEHLPAAAERFARRAVVVAAVLVRDGTLLAQRRGYPPWAAGHWELPGGHVERGEPEPAAVRRECGEELELGVEPGERVGVDAPLPGRRLLRCYVARLADAAEPRAVDHPEIRWVGADELPRLDWLDGDRVLLDALQEMLR
jgi:8-oxo-dGTP diphosphatase